MSVSNHIAVLRSLCEDSDTASQTVYRPPLNSYDITTKFSVVEMLATAESKSIGYSLDDVKAC